jgi:hypothetical protein
MCMKKSQCLKLLLSHGYFPKELPPPFATVSLSRHIDAIAQHWRAHVASLPRRAQENIPSASSPEVFNMARRGHMRRLLSIPNPVNQYYLCDNIAANWRRIQHILNKSPYSLTKCEILAGKDRAVDTIPFSNLPEHRIRHYCNYAYVIQTDVARFYHAIYTHAIPWALHGKEVAKQNRRRDNPRMFGNKLDFYVRQCQDGQTIGIPVGPDTSRIISEIILSMVDQVVNTGLRDRKHSGFRYIDDMFFCFENESDAQAGLGLISASLREFELDLNSSKTLLTPATRFNEEIWPQLVNRLCISGRGSEQRRSIVAFFTEVIEIAQQYENESIANYALKLSAKTSRIEEENWELYESFLIRLAREHTNTIDVVCKIFCTYAALGYTLTNHVTGFVNNLICDHCPANNHFEVAWALWLARSLNLSIREEAAAHLSNLKNSVCALLSLDLLHRGAVQRGLQTDLWLEGASGNDLYRSRWLLIYEGVVQKWLGDRHASIVDSDPFFAVLKSKKVRFFDINAFNKLVNIPGSILRFTGRPDPKQRIALPGNVRVVRQTILRFDERYVEQLGNSYPERRLFGLDDSEDERPPFSDEEF